MRHLVEIGRTGIVAILLNRLRSAVTIASLVAVLLPYVAGIGLSKGIQDQAEVSIRWGADLYVSGRQFGRNVPLSLEAANQIAQIDGVTNVVPRIIGRIVLGVDREEAVLVGIPREEFPSSISCVEGRLPGAGNLNELVIGTELARRLKLTVGTLIQPFYHSSKGERVSKVVGIFKSDVSLWQARLLFTSFETAGEIFDQREMATDFLVDCRPGYQANVRATILRTLRFPASGSGSVRTTVTAREDLQGLLPTGLLHREGIFNLHFLLVFAVGILVILVTSGFGLAERRREIGILKAMGWQTDEILLRSLVESLMLSLAGASIAVLLAYVWLVWLNGFWLASIFVSNVDTVPTFKVPFRLTPIPVMLSFLISLVVVMTGALYSSWRAAIASPVEAMR